MSKGSQFSQEAEEIEETESIERWSEPYFLRKVLKEGLGDDRNMHNLMAMAVHAVLLDAGFVGFDPVSKLQIDHMPDKWPSSPVPIYYSLPELSRHDDKFGSNMTDYVVIKFQTLG
ncbi:F-box protein SKIP22-like protein [Corchorus capsularis]|uniref:F-box protein SKIP22-like protein n=1 Tax=Corchorus capsularis TaxID=210143 RepID=A0A1R3JFD2_COCAP|nr:F-box protein SKIP22-like protein [Corchorus capsularis]